MNRLLALLLLAASCGTAFAHSASTAYLEIDAAADGGVPLTWTVSLRDLDAVLDLDANGDGRLTWGEVQDRAADLVRLAHESVVALAQDRGCDMLFEAPRLARAEGSGYAVFAARADCAGAPVRIRYRFLQGIDASHRVLITAPGFAAPRPLAGGGELDLARAADTSFGALLADGIAHIVGGPDHLLFLVALLLPAVLVRQGERWAARAQLRPALAETAWIVTAFTVAHSITLGLASFDVVEVPARVIEPLIAATVLAAALNNLKPIVTRRLAWVAFAFGLVHGFGFAEVLAPLDLPPPRLALALAGFNLGVEIGQLVIVAGAFVALAALRHWRGYPRWVLGGGSALLAAVACAWLVERVFDVPVFALAFAQR
ncbi:MAG TPA: HupE/UreJ family protein [Burkholderiaceae bacterium]|jgi:hypothetical protein|nr:HupE/UreJ family protein [Burkholderiaceae bacterium]